MSHTHKCMRCDEHFYCLTQDTCKAGPDVLPRVMVKGPVGPQVFEHVCQGTPEGRRSPPAGALESGSLLEAPRELNLGSAVPSRALPLLYNVWCMRSLDDHDWEWQAQWRELMEAIDLELSAAGYKTGPKGEDQCVRP